MEFKFVKIVTFKKSHPELNFLDVDVNRNILLTKSSLVSEITTFSVNKMVNRFQNKRDSNNCYFWVVKSFGGQHFLAVKHFVVVDILFLKCLKCF